jgi:hypothetical protein
MGSSRRAGNLNDYFSVNLERSLSDDKLNITPLSFLFEVRDWSGLPDNSAIPAAPSITIHSMDNAEPVVGFQWIQAESSTVFGALSGQNEVFAQILIIPFATAYSRTLKAQNRLKLEFPGRLCYLSRL